MEEITAILSEHAARYPETEPRDAVKLLYQREFGGGHLIADPASALIRLREEFSSLPKTDTLRVESIGNGMTRVYLNGLPETSLETLSFLFVTGAEKRGDPERFAEALEQLERVTRENRMPFSPEALGAFLKEYREAGCPMLSHSETYRKAYAPAYRVVPERLAVCLPLCLAIDRRLAEKKQTALVLDGRCGSGKTTVASLLEERYGTRAVHMDDFFVPPDLRDEAHERLPIHYERFEREILPRLHSPKAFSYTAYHCHGPVREETAEIPAGLLRIVEGSYSMASRFGESYDLSGWVTCSPEEQLRRLTLRCGSETLLARFREEWIPREERYRERERPDARADFILETGCSVK